MYPVHKCSSGTLSLLFVYYIKDMQLKSLHFHRWTLCTLAIKLPISLFIPNSNHVHVQVIMIIYDPIPANVVFPIISEKPSSAHIWPPWIAEESCKALLYLQTGDHFEYFIKTLLDSAVHLITFMTSSQFYAPQLNTINAPPRTVFQLSLKE